MLNIKPLCDIPSNGCMVTASGYRLCCNPKHKDEQISKSGYPLGPVWHPDWLTGRYENGKYIPPTAAR